MSGKFKSKEAKIAANLIQTVQNYNVFVIQQHSKAIKKMRETILKLKNLRTTLVASIVIMRFEIYHWSYETATKQVHISM